MTTNVNQHKGFPATFIGQSKTRLVNGRTKWKIINKYGPSTSDPQYVAWEEENYPDKKSTELEEIYKEFCKKVHNYIIGHPFYQGENMPSQIILPDFTFEVIPRKLSIE